MHRGICISFPSHKGIEFDFHIFLILPPPTHTHSPHPPFMLFFVRPLTLSVNCAHEITIVIIVSLLRCAIHYVLCFKGIWEWNNNNNKTKYRKTEFPGNERSVQAIIIFTYSRPQQRERLWLTAGDFQLRRGSVERLRKGRWRSYKFLRPCSPPQPVRTRRDCIPGQKRGKCQCWNRLDRLWFGSAQRGTEKGTRSRAPNIGPANPRPVIDQRRQWIRQVTQITPH